MQEFNIAIGLPSWQEEDSITNVAETIAQGLIKYFPNVKAIIVNIDNSSSDNTVTNFLKADTKTIPKKVILTQGIGKGINVLTFFKFVIDSNIKYAAIYDTDLISIKPDWVKKMFKPLLEEEASLIVPVYKRNPFEGNLTNHVSFPILSSVLHNKLRQPIGGEFSFDQNLIKDVLNAEKLDFVYQYGIDIFISTTAIFKQKKIKEVYLGDKLHKPSFPKMVSIFYQSCTTLLFQLSKNRRIIYDLKNVLHQERSINRTAIYKTSTSPSVESLINRRNEMKNELAKVLPQAKFLKKHLLALENLIKNDKPFLSKHWVAALSETINYSLSEDLTGADCLLLVKEMLPLYLARVLSYFQEMQGRSRLEIEKIFINQAKLLSEALNVYSKRR